MNLLIQRKWKRLAAVAMCLAAWRAVGGYQPEVRVLTDRALLLKLSIQGLCASGLTIGTTPAAGTSQWDRLHDAEFLHRLLVPALAFRRGGIPRGQLDDTSRVAFRTLAKGSLGLSEADRARTAELLADWGWNLGESDVLHELRAGRAPAIRRPVNRIKRHLRSLYKALR